MKFHQTNCHKFLVSTLSLIFITSIPLILLKNSHPPLSSSLRRSTELGDDNDNDKCDVFSGKWVINPQGPYYTNETCPLIIDQHNCMKFGRPDLQFMKWRWKPFGCELPLFDATQFLEIVRGKSMAFVGDSVGRNQMQSLLCLLAHVTYAKDISNKSPSASIYSIHLFYSEYNFTLSAFWSPFLVKYKDSDPEGHSFNSLMSLYLDEADEEWANEIKNFDYVIISVGQWFFRPLLYYQDGQLIGCHKCNHNNITSLTRYYGYKMAFQTTFKTLLSLKNYKGVTFLRTFSAAHFENGDWKNGGSCDRTRPFTKEMKIEEYNKEFYLTQVEEFRKAKVEGIQNGLRFVLINITEIMWLRPDGHPNRYGHSMNRNVSVNDCVHWCLPGPIDTWNEFLVYLMKRELLLRGKLKKNA
ncbi:hypothetical protein ERO13_A03G016100v2 [Gossypium hirsutum]|uniref:Protein trichome birefringence-like 19 n=3 Tax=Gossypium TaxID=3633 RepID=A0A1U8PX57_GOSHI|nr:protein trichome birefringence-like 19 [Gossypium hirsutum]KAG4206582.1 hypothetical protein ERO13_A03G016100v2 [Gossypium hirsutum]